MFGWVLWSLQACRWPAKLHPVPAQPRGVPEEGTALFWRSSLPIAVLEHWVGCHKDTAGFTAWCILSSLVLADVQRSDPTDPCTRSVNPFLLRGLVHASHTDASWTMTLTGVRTYWAKVMRPGTKLWPWFAVESLGQKPMLGLACLQKWEWRQG